MTMSSMDPTPLHVENLREALRQIQRHVVVAIATATALAALELGLAVVRTEQGVGLQGLPFGVTARAAKLILAAVYMSATYLALGVAFQLKALAAAIADDRMRQAVLSYPSPITSPDSSVRVPATLAPGVIFALFTIAYWWHHRDRGADLPFFAAIMGCMPYGGLVYVVKQALRPPSSGQA